MRAFLVPVVAAAVLLLVVVALLRTAGDQPAEVPPLTTAWGEPDLQGLWANEYRIPLQRSPEFADQEFFTDEQLAAREERAETLPTFSDRTAARGSEQDVAGAYDIGFQPARRPTGRRTSLISDPPNGRIPPPRFSADFMRA